jgi:hypothetical protein
LYCLSKSPGNNSPPSRFPNGAPMGRDALLQNLPFTYLSESPIQGPRPGSPTRHLWRELPVSRTFFAYPNKQGLQMEQNVTFLSKSSVQLRPFTGPPAGPYGERRSFPEPSLTQPSGSPVKELSHEREKTYGHRPWSTTRTEILHTMWCGLVPQGNHLRHCCHYQSATQPSARLASVNQSPVSQRVSYSSRGRPLHTRYPLSRDPGYGTPYHLEVPAGGWIYGRHTVGICRV